MQGRFKALSNVSLKANKTAATLQGVSAAFNLDVFGLPQNEESVAACRTNTNIVLGGTNDYRGLLDPGLNFTGWHLSMDAGTSVANEGLLPEVVLPGAGTTVSSGGDPVVVAGQGCSLYAATISVDPVDPLHNPDGVSLYRSDAATLASCPGGSDQSCWPVKRVVAEAAPSHFLDKEWFDVGISGAAGEVVWIAYADFVVDDNAPLGFTSASVMAVRCSSDLSDCTAPILISGADPDIQFADVTVGPDGRVYITWVEIQGELEFGPQTFVHKLRIADPGSTTFGPTRVIAVEENAIPSGGVLQANSFVISTYPKNAVAMVGSTPRIFLVWDACAERPLDVICEEPVIKLSYSDNAGLNWSSPMVLSRGGVNYFPTISADPTSGILAVAWYTNRFNQDFQNAQDVELMTLDAATVKTKRLLRLTRTSNETEADPIVGASFIGDYFEVFAHDRQAWVHFNANYRKIELLGLGLAINQQDNFLIRTRF